MINIFAGNFQNQCIIQFRPRVYDQNFDLGFKKLAAKFWKNVLVQLSNDLDDLNS